MRGEHANDLSLPMDRIRLAIKLHENLAGCIDTYLEETGQLLRELETAAERLNRKHPRSAGGKEAKLISIAAV